MDVRRCVHFHLYAKLRRISRFHCRQLRCQACTSTFIPSVIDFSTSSPSVVGLCLPFSLFVIGCLRVCPRQLKMAYSDYVEQRILFYCWLGKSFVQITRCLVKEGNATAKIGIYQFIHRYEETEMISRMPGSGKASKITADAQKII